MKKDCSTCRFNSYNYDVANKPCRLCVDWDEWQSDNHCNNCVVKELEKLKAEIQSKGYVKDEYGDIRSDVLKVQQVTDIIDKYISKSKGENNE